MQSKEYFQPKSTKLQSGMYKRKKEITYKLNETAWIDQGKLPDNLEIDFDEVWSFKPENLGQDVWKVSDVSSLDEIIRSILFIQRYQT